MFILKNQNLYFVLNDEVLVTNIDGVYFDLTF